VPYELFIALRYLRAKRKQVMVSVISVVAISAVAAGVASLIMVLAMMTGFREEIQTKILSGTSDINLLRKDGRPLENYKEIEEQLKQFAHVRAAAATLYQLVLIQGKKDNSPATLKGVDFSAPREANEVFKFTIKGDPASLAEPERDRETGAAVDRMVIGRDLADATGLQVGDVASIITTQGHLTPVGMAPLYRDFVVAGIFQSGLADYDSTWAYVSLEAMQRLSGQQDVAQLVQMKVDDIYAVKAIDRELLKTFGPDFDVQDWQELNAPVYTLFNYQKLLSSVALLIVIGIAALNIINVLILMVMEKQRDVAILKSMGATRKSVLSIFMAQGILIGVVGTVLGIAVGWGFCYFADSRHLIKLPPGAYSLNAGLTYLPFHAHLGDTIAVIAITLIMSFISTIYPSWSAARFDPVEALRYE
jgi:lipoprotein-releasing system permease protein